MDGVSPLAAPGKAAVTREKQREVEEKLRQSFDDFAMIYFYQPDCSFCQEQDGIMQYFVRKYDWEIKKIDITRETAHASRFNVTTTPTIILVYKNSTDYIPITAGVASMAEIEDRVYRGIRLLSGEITPQNYSIYDFQQGGVLDTTKKGPAQR
jgi:conjugal transfer pilus assembly protein TraF